VAQRDPFWLGVLAGILAAIAAQSANWLITPGAHPDSSVARGVGVGIQGVLCLAVAIGLLMHHRRGLRRSDAA
jgi:hypothetical protein